MKKTDTDDDTFDVSPEAVNAALGRLENQPDSAAGRLKSFVERVERLEEEKAALAFDIKEVYAEAKGTGFDSKIIRQVIRLRKMEAADRAEQQELLELYARALGMIA